MVFDHMLRPKCQKSSLHFQAFYNFEKALLQVFIYFFIQMKNSVFETAKQYAMKSHPFSKWNKVKLSGYLIACSKVSSKVDQIDNDIILLVRDISLHNFLEFLVFIYGPGPYIWFWTIRIAWSWTIHELKGFVS